MQRYLSKILIFLLVISFVVPLITNAQVQIQNPLNYRSFAELLGAVVGFLMKLAIPIATIAIIIGGFYFITAGGNPDKIKVAKQIIIWALIGLIIVLSAWGFIAIIKDIF